MLIGAREASVLTSELHCGQWEHLDVPHPYPHVTYALCGPVQDAWSLVPGKVPDLPLVWSFRLCFHSRFIQLTALG